MATIYRITILAFLLILLISPRGWGQENAPEASVSGPYSGMEYLVAFPPSDPDRVHQFMGLIITSESTTDVTVEVPDVPSSDLEPITTFQSKVYKVRKGEATNIEIHRLLEPKYSDEASPRTVRVISSRAPISVTVVNARQTASGGYPVLPIDRWGTFYLPTALPAVATSAIGVPTSQLLITAAENGTVVTISPSAKTTFFQKQEEIRITLNRKETYLLQADPSSAVGGTHDLSGTRIRATKPIGVVAGHGRASLSGNPTEAFPSQTYSAWHASMQMPTDSWGKEYFSTPLRGTGDRFKVIAAEAGTVIRMTMYDASGNVAGEKTISLENEEEVADIYAPEGMNLTGPIRWSSDKTFSLSQIRLSDGDNSNPENSPAMIRLVPTSHYASRSVFALPTSLKGRSFTPFNIGVIANAGSQGGNPFENITVDGVQATQLPNVTILQINGNLWQMQGTIPTGGHTIFAGNGVSFTGNVSGDNGTGGNVALAWELPTWSITPLLDLTPPRVDTWETLTQGSEKFVGVVISDITPEYFSGVETIELSNSPGWEIDPLSTPFDPDMDVEAFFRIKNGVDPSGPLSLLLRDYDGNQTIVKVFDGICAKTAYPDDPAKQVAFTVKDDAVKEDNVLFNASTCGDEAHVTTISLDPNGSATQYLEDPIISGASSTPYTISANGVMKVLLRTKADLKTNGTFTTTLNLEIDGTSWQVPITLNVDVVSGVAEDEVRSSRLLNVLPNPSHGPTSILFAEPMGQSGRIEIVDATGRLVRTFNGKDVAGVNRIEWNGNGVDGTPVAPGVYFVTLTNAGITVTHRVVIVR